jgi:hypothetical protein
VELTPQETTSEEKLLKLIRKKNNAAAGARSGEHNGDPPVDARRAQGDSEPRNGLLAFAPRVLMAAALGLAVYGAAQYVTFNPQQAVPDVSFGEDSEDSEEEAPDFAPLEITEGQTFDAYRESMEARDIFQAPWEKPAAGGAPAGNPALELAKNLRVVGILLDADPKAIIEDMAMKQTFFVSPGDRVGGALLEEIREDRVILIFNEERVELVP